MTNRAIDIVVNLFTPEAVRNGQTGFDATFMEQVRMPVDMRGGVTMEDLLHTYSYEDREMLYEIIKDNINTTQETRLAII